MKAHPAKGLARNIAERFTTLNRPFGQPFKSAELGFDEYERHGEVALATLADSGFNTHRDGVVLLRMP